MKKILLIVLFFSAAIIARSQSLNGQLTAAVNALEKDSQFAHAILAFYVVDTKTGKPVYERNIQTGLAPASCQKIITSASAFELLGPDFKYSTKVFLTNNNVLAVEGSGDPTLGSWRYNATRNNAFFTAIGTALKAKKITRLNDIYVLTGKNFSSNALPTGWIWEDIGNYYGAGAAALNWRENQYDLILQPGKAVGDEVKLVITEPAGLRIEFNNELATGAKGSGDNAYIFPGLNGSKSLIAGTIPLGENNFTISGAVTDPAGFFTGQLRKSLLANGIKVERDPAPDTTAKSNLLFVHNSPGLDSINYWFLKKSVNLYGEAFIKTIAYQKSKFGSTTKGIELVKDLWKTKGVEPGALNILDGSGLSPVNRITVHALVTVLQYAKQQSWFGSFYNAMPEMNGIKMKDGYIGGVRSYAGYVKSRSGNEYTFSFIVNNFDGSPGTVRQKIWKLLDLLK